MEVFWCGGCALKPATHEACGGTLTQVITVHPETAALEALVLMAKEGIAGVGVVNSLSGALIGNFSFSDLRCHAGTQLSSRLSVFSCACEMMRNRPWQLELYAL